MRHFSIRWSKLIGGLGLIVLGVLLLSVETLPAVVKAYWPVVLIAWGVWKWFARYQVKEDAWAGTDYGTGLYVIRRRRRPLGGLRTWLPGFVLIALGGFFLWANLNSSSGVTIGPIAVIVLGGFQVWRSFAPPPRSDFYTAG
jgi:hypothetical protein